MRILPNNAIHIGDNYLSLKDTGKHLWIITDIEYSHNRNDDIIWYTANNIRNLTLEPYQRQMSRDYFNWFIANRVMFKINEKELKRTVKARNGIYT